MENRKLYEFIIEAGVKLSARATTTATAIALLYKFINKIATETDYCPYTAATSCIYLAGKVEEDLIKIRDVINVCHKILHPSEQPLEIDDSYWDLRDGIGKMEMLILRTLQFNLSYTCPHKYLLHYLYTLQNWMPRDHWEKNVPVAKTSWTLLQDSYAYPDLVLNNDPKDFAICILFITLKIYGEDIPNANDDDEKPWWKILHKEMKAETLTIISEQILGTLYNDNECTNKT